MKQNRAERKSHPKINNSHGPRTVLRTRIHHLISSPLETRPFDVINYGPPVPPPPSRPSDRSLDGAAAAAAFFHNFPPRLWLDFASFTRQSVRQMNLIKTIHSKRQSTRSEVARRWWLPGRASPPIEELLVATGDHGLDEDERMMIIHTR